MTTRAAKAARKEGPEEPALTGPADGDGADGADGARQQALDVIDVVQLGRPSILHVDRDDFPVGLAWRRHDAFYSSESLE